PLPVIPASAQRVSGNPPKGRTGEPASGCPPCASLGGHDVARALRPSSRRRSRAKSARGTRPGPSPPGPEVPGIPSVALSSAREQRGDERARRGGARQQQGDGGLLPRGRL